MAGWCMQLLHVAMHVTIECELRSSFTGGIPPRRHRHPTGGLAGECGAESGHEEEHQLGIGLYRPIFAQLT